MKPEEEVPTAPLPQFEGNWAYQFEAKGIQRYIGHSGKLRDIVGASDLITGLASSQLDEETDRIGLLLAKLKLEEGVNCCFSRRAGGAFCIHANRADLLRIRRHWRFIVLTQLPGLEFLDALECAKGGNPLDAMRACFEAAGGIRSNYATDVPGWGRPIGRIASNTGRPAVSEDRYPGETILLDSVVTPQRRHARDARVERLAGRFAKDASEYSFPRNMEDPDPVQSESEGLSFPYRKAVVDGKTLDSQDRRIAVVHADLSGLGALFREEGRAFKSAKENCELALQIEKNICIAVQSAVGRHILSKCDQGDTVPARPVLLGGDDITIIVRADLAIDFTIELLREVERQCRNIGNNRGLSACAGLAIVNRGTPYLQAFQMADSLCGYAKNAVKNDGPKTGQGEHSKPGFVSAMAFHLHHHTASTTYEGIAPLLLDSRGKALSGNPYRLGVRAEKDNATELCTIRDALCALPGGAAAVRALRSLLIEDQPKAERFWERWWQVARDVNLVEAKNLAQALGGGEDGRVGLEAATGLLFDAQVWIDILGGEACARQHVESLRTKEGQ